MTYQHWYIFKKKYSKAQAGLGRGEQEWAVGFNGLAPRQQSEDRKVGEEVEGGGPRESRDLARPDALTSPSTEEPVTTDKGSGNQNHMLQRGREGRGVLSWIFVIL